MIILDTNVVSELQGRKHSEHLLLWLSQYERETLFLTTVVIAEMRYGLELLPQGRRQEELLKALNTVQERFLGRILGFSLQSASYYGVLRARRKHMGRPMEAKDAVIAAICLSHGATLATRNVKDFKGLDLRLVNPFEGA
ncbi:type II toxin-antitoxin system VapC family toxin [Rhizobium sp. XQZ8]|uniref:type II toxin-antitoxin system VapC family toxin n=1 Tax=Rhizobium populisoli TaxID=2859785 RepID=UPI001C686CD6|nr:type II toxin-antitoxin system VapC family toxin [Rhizobium populisoli]MBW6423320.1 type II toxin-antitoxin system VapC family toxin [Rhizobium populisoli]